VPILQRTLAEDAGHGALGALWSLHQLKALDDATARSAFKHSYPEVRMWAVRLVGDKYGINRGLGAPGIGATDARSLTPETMAALSELTRRELNLEVRAQIASTARRLVTPQALTLASLLATRTNPVTDRPVADIRPPALAATPASADSDVNDPYIPLLIWWILEAHVKLDREAVLAMFEPDAFWDQPMVQEHLLPRIMKRFALEGRRQDLLVAARLLRMAPTPAHAGILIEGFGEAYRGREMAGLPDELLQAMADSGQSPLVLRVRQGERKAIQEALSALRNGKTPIEDRILYARIFGEVRIDDAVPALLSIAAGKEPDALRKAALVALMMYDQPDIGPWAAAQLPKTSGDVQTAFLALMASRASWSADLLRAVETGRIMASAIPPDIVARIRAHQDEAVTKLAARIFPRAAAGGGTDAKQRLAEVEAALKGGSGNPYAGEQLYSERCASCHKLFFKGGKIGPELTYYQRDNLGTMLPSILTPSVEIREGFEYTMVETTDGRSLSGFVVERDPQVVVLRGLEGADITLRLSEIKEMRPMGRSLMPDGLIDDLDDQQLRDLFAYLRITQPIAR
jgi:putative heme-binding domain-containing protein